MLKNTLIALLTLLLFSACTPKVEYIYLKADKHKFAVPAKIEPITVNVVGNDVVIEKERYISYITLLRAKIENLVSQIEEYGRGK